MFLQTRRITAKVAIAMTLSVGAICLSNTPVVAGTTSYQYDALGRVIKVAYPDSKQICYAYDSAGNRTQVKRQATGSCTIPGSTLISSSSDATTDPLDMSAATTVDSNQTTTDSVATFTNDTSASN